MARQPESTVASPAQAHWAHLAHRAGYDVATAAAQLHLSVRQLERSCQRDLGCCPSAFFQAQRMAHAAQLLRAGQPIKTVATQLGYTQPGNLSRDFKRHFGRSPRAFLPRLGLPPEPQLPPLDLPEPTA